MKVMHVGQEVRATHGLTSSHPRGWIISRGSRGVVTKVTDSEPLLYSAQFRVYNDLVRFITVKDISSRDIVPLSSAQGVPDQSFSQAS